MYHRPKLKCKNVKLLENNIGENLGDIQFGDNNTNYMLHKRKIGKVELTEIKNIFTVKDAVKTIKRQPIVGENLC